MEQYRVLHRFCRATAETELVKANVLKLPTYDQYLYQNPLPIIKVSILYIIFHCLQHARPYRTRGKTGVERLAFKTFELQ